MGHEPAFLCEGPVRLPFWDAEFAKVRRFDAAVGRELQPSRYDRGYSRRMLAGSIRST